MISPALPLTHLSSHSASANYTKTLVTLEESLRTGQFARYSQKKKQEIWSRLCHYARQLGIKIKAPIVTACLAAGLSLATPTQAQVSFTLQSGAANPLNGVSIAYSKTAFVDIDGDGDKDVFIGSSAGPISYYKNTGTSTAPVFTLQTGAANPLNSVAVTGGYSAPAFVDIDGDGDKDVFIGQGTTSAVLYYKNTGTATAPVFTQQTGAANPLNSVTSTYNAPAFVDIDGDGDQDVFFGDFNGTVIYYKNTGTATAPVFTLQSGAANPLNAVSGLGSYTTPTFLDADKNGTMDAVVGGLGTHINYYQNTGTTTAPVFTQQGGTSNPFNGVSIAGSSPAAVDIDGDTKLDIFTGSQAGPVSYFKNTSVILPLQLLAFTGTHQKDYNQLQWQTADEVNTQQFNLETSSNGVHFTTIATINAAGYGNNHYNYQDKTAYNGKVFYRLKMIDFNGSFTYSNIIWINSQQTGCVTLYPNPARESVTISIGNSGMINTMAALYSSTGILLQKIVITGPQQQIDVQPLAKGTYVLKFADGTVSNFIKE